MAVDGGCAMDVVHRINERYRAWRALKSVLTNRVLGMDAKKCLYERIIVTNGVVQTRCMGYKKF